MTASQIISTSHQTANITLLIENGQVMQCWPDALVKIGAIHAVKFTHVAPRFNLAQAVLDNGQAISVKLSARQKIEPGQWGLITVTAQPFQDKPAQAVCNAELAGRYLVIRRGTAAGIHIRHSLKTPQQQKLLQEDFYPELEHHIAQLLGFGGNIEIVLRRNALGLKTAQPLLDEARLLVAAVNEEIISAQQFAQKGQIFSGFNGQQLAQLEAPDALLGTADSIELEEYFSQIDACMQQSVPLENGAMLWVETTRAGMMIDVDSGKSGLNGLDLSRFALPKIMHILRLRGRGGRVLIDFPVTSPKHRQALMTSMTQIAQTDSKMSALHGFTSSGLFELVRRHSITPLEQWWVSA